MTLTDIVLLVLLGAVLALQIMSLLRVRRQQDGAATLLLLQQLQQACAAQQQAAERGERDLRAEIQQNALATRQELGGNFSRFQQAVGSQLTSVATLQNGQIDGFAQQLAKLAESNGQQLEAMRQALTQAAHSAREEQAQAMARFGDTLNQTMSLLTESTAQRMAEVREEQRQAMTRFGDTLTQTMAALTESNAQRMGEVRATLETKIRDLQTDNAARLEEMRRTVDEKLHATLEHRLGESFKLVSERLEKVHQGLGEMQALAIGVGDLKRVLTNVKTRGTWGEVQLAMLLEQVLTPDQYGKNVECVPGSGERVEFAIKLPGQSDSPIPCWMPVDAKFPKEQYERLCEAAERADGDGVALAGRELERAVRGEAKTICEKYLSPPLTTDFAILFLPTEGLYAEVMRRPGLADELQRTCRVTIAGPSTLTALLSSLQMGFRTLALEKRSSEVWQVLGAVKTEFGKFGDVLASTKLALEKVTRNIDQAEVRSRQMARKLKSVEALPSEVAQQLLGVDGAELQDE